MSVILLTGSTGQVGSELVETMRPLGEVIAPSRDEFDLANPESLRKTIRSLRPRWIVNPAAYTAVDKAESEPDLAYAINRDAVRVIGEEARGVGAGVVHFSTDYVFNGKSTRSYEESDPADPLGIYGMTKLAGEAALSESGAPHLIFRTSWVYGSRGKNFLLTILKAARERELLRIVNDQHGAPTWSRDLARMTAAVVRTVEDEIKGEDLSRASRMGIYHAGGAGKTTWFDFAAAALEIEGRRKPEQRLARIEAIPTTDYPTPARRPANSLLNCSLLAKRFGWEMMDWRDSLREVMAEL